MTNFDKVLEMGKRIYNNKMLEQKDETGKIILSDDIAIKALVEKTFNSNGEYSTVENLRSFNKLIVEVAAEEADAKIEPILNLLADYSKIGRYDTKVYEVPKQARISMALTATGTGVDFVRISSSKRKLPARPDNHQFGVYYNIDKMISDPVNEFRNAVNYVVEYKVKYIFNQIIILINKAKTALEIPAKQVKEDANIQLADFRAIENALLRYGRGVKPIMIADRNLIDAFAMKQLTTDLGVSGKNGILATDDLKNEILRESEIKQISRTIAIATDNPFIDEAHTKVELPYNEGILVAGGNKSPIGITEYGSMRVAQDLPDIEDERVNMKIDMRMDITLLCGRACGFIKDAAVLL